MIYVAFGHHVDFSHSYRQDAPTADGFGHDIDVISRTLDVLDEHPWARCDWDIECANALETFIPEYAPELLERIVDRVRDGRDIVRHMSWSGEMLSALTADELAESVARSRQSLERVFTTSGVDESMYSQEMMYSPDMPGLLTAAGIEWMTLFYSATPFSAFRRDLRLEGTDAYNPLRLAAADGDASIAIMPAYHHADLLDFAGLDGWCAMLHDRYGDADCLIHISFDADAASWPGVLASSLPVIADLEFVECTTAGEYVASHTPTREITITRDLADGAMDGYGNWAEKPINHRLFTAIEAGRRAGADIASRLQAMKTTNFGLAVPHLHPGRVAAVERLIEDFGGFPLPDAPEPPHMCFDAPELPVGRFDPRPGVRFSAVRPWGDNGLSVWIEVEFPDTYAEDDAEPCPIVLDWELPITVHKANFRGSRSAFTITENQDSLNNALTPGWAAFSNAAGDGILVGFDARIRAGAAALPLRIADAGLRINPFGTYWGELPDMHPDWTGASGAGHDIAVRLGEHVAPSGPAFAGASLCLRLGILAFDGDLIPEPALF